MTGPAVDPGLPPELWAPSGLRVVAGDLELTPVCDADLPALVELVLDGVHAPDAMPFVVPWTTAPRDELPRRFAAHHWGVRAAFSADDFHLDLTVRRAGVVVGVQGFSARHYPQLRTTETGSWLGLPHQGRGTGTKMRQAVCAFLFDRLGARRVTSGAYVDNPASLAVSRKVGYVENGRGWLLNQGEEAEHVPLLLEPGRFVRGEPIEVTGDAPLRSLLGVSSAS